MHLIRKISRAKWEHHRNHDLGFAEGEISADSVTADLRTQDNKLSLWRSSSDSVDEIDEVVLALAAGLQKIERIDVVWVTEQELNDIGQTVEESDGKTPVADLRGRHVHLPCLDYVRLGRVAQGFAPF